LNRGKRTERLQEISKGAHIATKRNCGRKSQTEKKKKVARRKNMKNGEEGGKKTFQKGTFL